LITPGSGAPSIVARHRPSAPLTRSIAALSASSAPMPMYTTSSTRVKARAISVRVSLDSGSSAERGTVPPDPDQ